MPAAPPQRLPHAGPRLRALRVLLGYRTPAAAVEALGVSMHPETWREIEVPSRPRQLWDYEAAEISAAAGVPVSFFTAPLERLGDVGT